MDHSPQPVSSERSKLLLDFPIRFYTALRTIRLYPATNPQVQRSNTMLLQSFRELLRSSGEESIGIAVSDQRLIVCGEHIPDKDQTRPQIQGLISLFSQAKIHSLSFSQTLTTEECIQLTQTLSSLLAEKDVNESVSAMLDRAGIVSVTVDTKRYVALHEGEQIVREELLAPNLNISEEELANFILGGKNDGSTVPGVSRDLVETLISRLPVSGVEAGGPKGGHADTAAVIDFLKQLSREQDDKQRSEHIVQAAGVLSNLDPALLARLVANLPEAPNTDEVLGAALDKLTPQRLNALIAKLVSEQPAPPEAKQGANFAEIQPGELPPALQRLLTIDPERQTEISRSVAQNFDAKQLLLTPETTLAELPEHLLARLNQPEWSAPVLASAAQQIAAGQGETGAQVDFSAFNRMLSRYEHLLNQDQQGLVARQAGAQLASMEGMALGNLLSQKFQGIFGQRLYEQVMTHVSDDLLDETVEHLTPKQLNRMVAMLTSDIPLHIGKDGDADFSPADDAILKRLAQTKKGPDIKRAIAQNVDARTLLLNPETTIGELPEHLRARLHQPEWSAPVLASAAQQIAAGPGETGAQVEFSAFNRMLGQYEHLLDQDQQSLVARRAGAQLASMEGMALGNLLTQKFQGLFGQQLYEQVMTHVSDDLLDETVEHLSPKQLNRMVAMLTSDIPLHIGKDGLPDYQPADDSILKRLTATKKGADIERAIAQNVDARALLLTPETTIGELPEHLRARLHQPEWSVPVLASAAQQIASGQGESGGPVDFSAFNRMLDHYEHLLDREQQNLVARQAGAQLASMEGEALSNMLSHKFKGLFGQRLYEQVMSQVSDDLLDETVEHLTPKQLNRMVVMLTSDIPLHIGKDGDPNFSPADDATLKRLAATKKGPEIKRAIAQNIDARTLLLAPETAGSKIPEHLRARLHQPEWSVPVLASAAQQVLASHDDPENQVDFSAFNRMLAQYEHLLDPEQQNLVSRQAGAQLASMEGVALGNILSQKFKGLFGERLYEQMMTQVSDELLDESIDHLTPKQLNRMVAMLTSDIPLHIGKDEDPNFKPVDNTILKRLAHSKKGPEISRAIAQNIDARHILQATSQSTPVADQVSSRLQQPEWSAPVLVAATRQILDQGDSEPGAPMHLAAFEQMLDRYNTLLNQEEQLQVASQAGAQLASLEDQELGYILVKKYKNLFGKHLYQQVIAQLSPEKVERLTSQFRDLAEGRTPRPTELSDTDIEESYRNLMETVRSEKMRAIIALHREQKEQQEKELKITVERNLDSLLKGHFDELENQTFTNAIPERIRDLLLNGEEATADNLLMQLAIGLSHQQPTIRKNAFRALTATAEHLVRIGQWQRFAKLLPALQQGLQQKDIETTSCEQALRSIGALAGHHLTQEAYVSAFETVHFLQTLTTGSNRPAHVQTQAKETLKALCTEPVLKQLIDRFLHSENRQEIVGKILVDLGTESAKFQLQQLFDSESRFERKHLLMLIKQTGNPAISLLQEQLHQDSPWYVLRNVIRLLGEIGNPKLFSRIRPFIDHRDPRVQQEVIGAAVKIGGDDFKDFLLHALQNVDDSLKIRVINHVSTIHDERFVRPLTDLLESTKPFLGKNKNDLQVSICKALGAIGSKRATGSLNRVVQSKTMLGLTGYTDEVREAAARALHQIRLADHERGYEPRDGGGEESAATGTTVVSPEIQSVQDAEEAIFELARTGRQAEAREQLLGLIATAAKGGDAATAQRLRERIREIDPQPLSDIIHGEEIIGPEQQEGISEEDLEIWANLTDQLGTQEFRTIYEAFSERRYKPEETIVSQGEKNDALFFINQGSIKVSHLVGERELFITSLSRGQLAGENFFTSSLWTVTLTSLTPTRLYMLPRSAIVTWKEQFPNLRAKLYEYYLAYNNIGSMLQKKGLDRRQDKRFTLSRKIQVQPISTLDAPIGRGFRSETADISQGGMAFLVRIAHQENARLLLGRRMQVVLPVGGKIGQMNIKGLVIGIQPYRQLLGNFSVHFKFDRPIDNQELQGILG